MAWEMWQDIAAIEAWLDLENRKHGITPEVRNGMAVFRVTEQVREFTDLIISANGRAAAAYLAMTYEDTREARAALIATLADCAIISMAAIQHYTKDGYSTRAAMANQILKMVRELGVPPIDNGGIAAEKPGE